MENIKTFEVDGNRLIADFEMNNNLHIAISKLSNVQAKRIKQYYFEEKKEREIAKEEGLKYQSIHDSLEYGKEKIKKFLKKFEK